MYSPANLLSTVRPGHDYSATPFLLLHASHEDFARIAQHQENKANGEEPGSLGLLRRVFFDPRNIRTIQSELAIAVYRVSDNKYRIQPQDPRHIRVVMQYVYDNELRSPPVDIKEQASILNASVVKKLVPIVMDQIRAKLDYEQRFLSEDPNPMPSLPVQAAGEKRREIGSYLRFYD